jgi:hypothetical protein
MSKQSLEAQQEPNKTSVARILEGHQGVSEGLE